MKSLFLFIFALGLFQAELSWAEKNSTEKQLDQIISEYTEKVKVQDAFWAPYFNVESQLSQFGDYLTPEYLEREKSMVNVALEQLKAIDGTKLSESYWRTYQLFKGDMETSKRRFEFPVEYLSFNQMSNRLREYLDEANPDRSMFPFKSVKHFEDYIKRSEGFPAYIDRQIETLKKGVKEGYVLGCIVAKKTPNSYKDGLEKNLEKNDFMKPLRLLPKDISEEDRKRITEGFKNMVTTRLIPGFEKFDTYFKKEYIPRCRKSYGIGGIPNGKAWYAYQIKNSTDLEMDPIQLHQIGESEVRRIEKELMNVQKKMGFKGTFAQFKKSLRSSKYNFKNSAEMIKAFVAVKEKIQPRIPQYFSLTPVSDYSIIESGNPEDAIGSYDGPTETAPIGKFIINAKNLKAMPLFAVTSLSLHEAVPGHHFQIALQYEMKDQLSDYQRKIFGSNSFVEGWALYAEYLGREMGMFEDPLQKLGNLDAEMLRAIRLVVDTGIHAMNWSHDKTVAYMKAHLLRDDGDVEIEANRYSVWPGQALAYKVGQLKIIELRKKAEKELGTRFDIKAFHKAVIENGTVSLPVLEGQVNSWITSEKQKLN